MATRKAKWFHVNLHDSRVRNKRSGISLKRSRVSLQSSRASLQGPRVVCHISKLSLHSSSVSCSIDSTDMCIEPCSCTYELWGLTLGVNEARSGGIEAHPGGSPWICEGSPLSPWGSSSSHGVTVTAINLLTVLLHHSIWVCNQFANHLLRKGKIANPFDLEYSTINYSCVHRSIYKYSFLHIQQLLTISIVSNRFQSLNNYVQTSTFPDQFQNSNFYLILKYFESILKSKQLNGVHS